MESITENSSNRQKTVKSLPYLKINPLPPLAGGYCHERASYHSNRGAEDSWESTFYLKKDFWLLFFHNRNGTAEIPNCGNLVGAD